MSGDESDHSRGRIRYVVTRLSWRSAEFETWLKVFDWMHLSTRFTADDKPKRGAFPRYRRRGSSRQERYGDPVPGLPSNCYDAMWLASLGDQERSSLHVQPSVDLTHSEAVIASVFFCIVTFKTDPFLASLIGSHTSKMVQRGLFRPERARPGAFYTIALAICHAIDDQRRLTPARRAGHP